MINVYFYDIIALIWRENPFKDLPRSFTLILGLAPFKKSFG
jgi:hypothetical protein